MLQQLFRNSILKIQDKIYSYKTVRLEPSDWIEQNIYLTSAESNYAGFFSLYNWSRLMNRQVTFPW